jgi:hypothetical protein
MIQEAYRFTMGEMTAMAREAGNSAIGHPRERLRRFVVANFAPPVLDLRRLTLWASFISMIHVDREMAAIHREAYLEFRSEVEHLVADVFADAGLATGEAECRSAATKINGVIDGLWLEGVMAPDLFRDSELIAMVVESVEAILGLSLEETPETATSPGSASPRSPLPRGERADPCGCKAVPSNEHSLPSPLAEEGGRRRRPGEGAFSQKPLKDGRGGK